MDRLSEKPSSRSVFQQPRPEVSKLRQLLNAPGFLATLLIYSVITGYTRHPVALYILLTVVTAKFSRYTNKSHRQRLYGPPRSIMDLVTWRTRCIRSSAVIETGHRRWVPRKSSVVCPSAGELQIRGGMSFCVDMRRRGRRTRYGDDSIFQQAWFLAYKHNGHCINQEQVFLVILAVIQLDEPLDEIAMRTFKETSTAGLNSQNSRVYMDDAVSSRGRF